MPEIVEVELSDGETILAEVEIGAGDVGLFDGLKLAGAQRTITEMGRWARESVLEAMPEPPHRFGVEFGIKLAVKSGKLASVLAEASGEATVTVKMEWDTRA